MHSSKVQSWHGSTTERSFLVLQTFQILEVEGKN